MTVRVVTKLFTEESQFRHPFHYCWGHLCGFLGISLRTTFLPNPIMAPSSKISLLLLSHSVLPPNSTIPFPHVLISSTLPYPSSLQFTQEHQAELWMFISQREGGGIISARGGQDHDRKLTDTVDQPSWELMDSGPTAEEPAWDQTRPSACGQRFCCLLCLWDPW